MTGKDFELLCIGNALVDVFARADDNTCARYGITLPVQHVGIDTLFALLSELETSCPQENVSPLVISSGGAQDRNARHRACSDDVCNTACPQ